MKKTIETPVVNFVRLAWENAGGSPFAWLSYNQQVAKTMRIAAAGFNWQEGDLRTILAFSNSRYSIHKCLGENGIEWLYSEAVMAGNQSFCVDFEGYTERSPIIVDNVNGRQRDRLCVGSEFKWESEKVTVTSFNKDGNAIACSYSDDSRRKIKRRYEISPEGVKSARKNAKLKKNPAVVA